MHSIDAEGTHQRRQHQRQKSINRQKRNSLMDQFSRSEANNTRPRQSSGSDMVENFTHCQPYHTQLKPSLLSCFDLSYCNEENSSTKNPLSFVGFRNLFIVMYALRNLEGILQFVCKFDVKLMYLEMVYFWTESFWRSKNLRFVLYFIVSLALAVNLAVFIEKMAGFKAKRRKSKDQLESIWRRAFFLHSVNLVWFFALANYIVYFHISSPAVGTFCQVGSITVIFKIVSYVLTNKQLRCLFCKELDSPDSQDTFQPKYYHEAPYPRNLTFSSMYYFVFAPTLVYQPVYPRLSHRPIDRKRVVFKMVEMGTLYGYITHLHQTQAIPIFHSLLQHMESGSTASLMPRIELIVRLGTTSLLIWILADYLFFHDLLNLMADITKFGDRQFYGQWWNSTSIKEYWRLWNMPTTIFFKRHFIGPLRRKGWSYTSIMVFIFLISALVEELVVGVPTHNLMGISFIFMCVQLPLILASESLQEKKGFSSDVSISGNCMFWASFYMGHPFCILLYYFAWCIRNDYLY